MSYYPIGPHTISPRLPDGKVVTYQGHGHPINLTDLKPDSRKWDIGVSSDIKFVIRAEPVTDPANYANPNSVKSNVISDSAEFKWVLTGDREQGFFISESGEPDALVWTAWEDGRIVLSHKTGSLEQLWKFK